MIQNLELLKSMQYAFTAFPGMKPKAVKRNVLMVLLYLLILGIIISLYNS